MLKNDSKWIYSASQDTDVQIEKGEVENSELLPESGKKNWKEIILIVLCIGVFVGIVVISATSYYLNLSKNYILVKEHFEAGNYEEVVDIINKFGMKNYKDSLELYESSVLALRAQENEERYQELLEAYSKIMRTPFRKLENVRYEYLDLDIEDYKDSKQILSDILDYFTLAETIWNEYADIVYEHTLDMTTTEAENHAQNILSARYGLSKFEIQRIYIWWHDYVAEGGRFVHYDD